MEKIEYLTKLKNQIESMDKHHQIEILKILSKNMCKINENKSGVFVNMTFLEQPILEKIEEYLTYMKEQEENLITTEYQKQEFINSYFVEKEDKDNIPITYSIAN
jgi:hypothetical protein|tara:strand:- start:358 stop:672 length:315 start_codon:yes stop_codon:yes gene_type:complete